MTSKLQNIKEWISNLPVLKQFLKWSKSYSLPGLGGVPLYYIVDFIYKETMRDNITTRANSVAFSFFLALFPLIICVFTLLPLLPFTADYVEIFRENAKSVLPNDANNYLLDIIENLVNIKRGGLFSFGFILALFFASSGVLTLMFGFDKTYDKVFKERSYLKKRLVALTLTITLSGLFIIAFILLILGNLILAELDQYFGFHDVTVVIINILKSIVSFVLIYLGITIIYRYGPSLKNKISFFNPGALLATILTILVSVLFSYFVNNFGTYNEIYGSIGALIVIMLWLQFNAFVILIGYELNASIVVNKKILGRDKKPKLRKDAPKIEILD